MNALIIFLIILILGYISTNLLFEKIQSRFYVPSGIEYIFLGILLGPSFSDWINSSFSIDYPQIVNHDILTQLNPGISAAIGFVGLVYGLKFKFSEVNTSQSEHWRLTFSDILVSVIFIGGISFGLLYYFFYKGNNLYDIIAASYALSIIGSVTSNFTILRLLNKYKLNGKIASTLKHSSLQNVNINIILFGLLFGLIHIGSKEDITFTSTEWIVISIVMALIIGVLFFIFLGREENEHKLFVAVLGIALFTSGVAYYLNFSPLFMNFILGMILANLSKISDKIEDSLTRLLHPFRILIVVMAGFYWILPGYLIFAVSALIYVLLRYGSKYLSGLLSFYGAYNKENLTPNIGRGLFPHDIIACAMVIDYFNVFKNELTPIVMSSILISVIFFGIIGYSSVKNLLVDSGEITKEIP